MRSKNLDVFQIQYMQGIQRDLLINIGCNFSNYEHISIDANTLDLIDIFLPRISSTRYSRTPWHACLNSLVVFEILGHDF